MAKVGLVEDDEINRIMMIRRLEKTGHRVVTAVDGVDAIRMVESEIPDVILMDLDLPVMSGTCAARRIRENPAWRHIPIIAFTAHAIGESDPERSQCTEWDEYVTKPLNFPALLNAIEHLTSARCVQGIGRQVDTNS
jgi:two-component system, cell cycle response regulator DivK